MSHREGILIEASDMNIFHSLMMSRSEAIHVPIMAVGTSIISNPCHAEKEYRTRP